MSLIWSREGRVRYIDRQYAVSSWRRGLKPSSGAVTFHHHLWAAMVVARVAAFLGFAVEVRDRGRR